MKQLRLTITMLITLCLLLACDPGLPSTVIYDGNGADSGTAPLDSATYSQFDAVTVTDDQGSLVKAGYNLAGWMTEVDGTGTSYAPGALFAMGAEEVTLYAVWVQDSLRFASAGNSIILTASDSFFSGSLIIPPGVTAIGTDGAWGAFNGATAITSIILPPSLTIISGQSLAGCSGLLNVTLSDQLTLIGPGSFSFCSSLASLTIPSTVSFIGQYAFSSCSSLASVTMMPTTPPVCGASAFDGLPPGFQIKVPAASVAAYKAATGWSVYAANIVSQ